MQYRYFVHCRHAISVFTNTNFSYGITVLGSPNVPLHMYIEYRLNTWGWPEEELSLLSVLAAVGSCPFSTHSSSDSYSNDDNDNLNQKKKQTNKQKNEQQQIGRFSDLSDRTTEMAGCVGQVFSSCSTAANKQTNTHDKNKAIIQPPIRSEQDWLKRDLPLCIIDQNKFFFPTERKRKIKRRIAHSSYQSAEHGICFILLTKM